MVLEVGSPTTAKSIVGALGGVVLGAFAGDLLVGDEDAQQRAGPSRALGCKHPHRFQHRGERPLAVAGAAPVEPPVRLRQANGSDVQPSPTGTMSICVLKAKTGPAPFARRAIDVDAIGLVLVRARPRILRSSSRSCGRYRAASGSWPGGFSRVDRDEVGQVALHAARRRVRRSFNRLRAAFSVKDLVEEAPGCAR